MSGVQAPAASLAQRLTAPPVPWSTAIDRALYGERGFYRTSGTPARHFRTSAHDNARWATVIAALARRVEEAVGPGRFSVVDVGAGGGELLHELAAMTPQHWQLVGVDVAPRPEGLCDRVDWRSEPPKGFTGLLLANELLDVVPIDVAINTTHGPHRIDVHLTGEETLGPRLAGDALAWQQRWWPVHEPGDRIEIGRTRDALWRTLCACLDRGVAVAIDYAAHPELHRAGTLTGYRCGREVRPVPDGSCDLTAHVLFDSLATEGDLLITQHDALAALGVAEPTTTYAGDPVEFISGLKAAGDVATLADPSGLGGFTWLLSGREVLPPIGAASRNP